MVEKGIEKNKKKKKTFIQTIWKNRRNDISRQVRKESEREEKVQHET